MVAAEVKPVKLNISQECYLKNKAPFEQANENRIFKIILDDEALIGSHMTIKEISLWSDGKIFPIKSDEEPIYKDNSIQHMRKSNELFEDEIKTILNAKFVKLFVKYQDNVQEEHSANGRSPYFSTIITTVSKDQYLPVILPKVNINTALLDCTETLNDGKQRQSLYEILIVIGTLLGIGGFITMIMRYRRG